MLYPENIEEKLGFNTIRKWLKDFCISESGRQMIDNISFSSDEKLILVQMGQAMEIKSILELEDFPFPKSMDAVKYLGNCQLEGSYLEIEELLEVSEALDSASGIWNFLLNKNEGVEHLSNLLDLLYFDREIPQKIFSHFNDKGEIRDDASPELKKIRKELKNAEANLYRSLNNAFNDIKTKGYIPENLSPTIRDGRLVIPVLARFKRQVNGFIHDESATGQTVYIEPSGAIEANNALIELGYAERREIIKILVKLSGLFRTDLKAIHAAFKFLAQIDMVLAKARLTLDLNAFQPELMSKPGLGLSKARHPILFHNYKKTGKSVVALDLHLDESVRMLLVSGPNAGGKSVCLKTTGLIQYMIQCGIPVPVHPDSRTGVFKKIFVDIGDEQSIENDLSTYSSHLKNMSMILEYADRNSLILIDEFGTGTDPQFGGAIAEAILTSLIEKKCMGVITTHYGNLKDFARENDGMINGAMQFDVNKLEPLYILETGHPGSSFALEVAGKIGLDKKVLERARELIGKETISLEGLLNELSREKGIITKKLKEISVLEKELGDKIESYVSLKGELDSKKNEIIHKARQEAKELLSHTNREIEKTIRHIKENKAQKKETQKARSKLEDFKNKVRLRQKTVKPEKLIFITGSLNEGDSVYVEGSGVIGEILEMKGKSASVSVGGLIMKVNLDKLKKVKPGPQEIRSSKGASLKGLDIARKQSMFTNRLDIRGKRAEEATSLLENYIDDALLLGHQEIRILHGKGDGILRELVRDYLRQLPEVSKLEDEHVDRGGAGITVVSLR